MGAGGGRRAAPQDPPAPGGGGAGDPGAGGCLLEQVGVGVGGWHTGAGGGWVGVAWGLERGAGAWGKEALKAPVAAGVAWG